MTIIANLSSIFKLKPITPPLTKPFTPNMISLFAELCNRYAKSRSVCHKSLFGISNYAWVLKQFYANSALLTNYNLGKITTSQFLDTLLNIFSFLMNNEEVANPKKLLADTWNQLLEWDKESDENLEQLLNVAKRGEPVHLIANTNLLNLTGILALFQKNAPDMRWDFTAALKEGIDRRPIEIAPNVFLSLSFRYGFFKDKTPSLKDEIPELKDGTPTPKEGPRLKMESSHREKGTPGLVAELSKSLKSEQPILVSQYPRDLKVGSKLGMTTISAKRFYENLRTASQYIPIAFDF